MTIENSGADKRGQQLDSWKAIASYLKRDVRTVQRWGAAGRAARPSQAARQAVQRLCLQARA
jgi:hypothetical protein